jgi:hybrid polyketide synthase/nonribosomal peptide synthetase ACE1
MRSYFLAEECLERRFDARFFGISSSEANVMDPQARLLLETTYEALEAAGQTIEGLRGSDTSCYVGLMSGDYEQTMIRDEATLGKYHVTGIARSLMSNRISYFFDWHGASMTIDTACSSSLVAVHQAVQALRSGQSKVAIAAGANLLLDSAYYIAESKLQMLSPDGYSKMWDADANGYARGEGLAAIVMKRLADAEADGDHIECVIRETGVNQDGRTNGITM